MDSNVLKNNLSKLNEVNHFCVPIINTTDFGKNSFLDSTYKETIVSCDAKQSQVKVISDIQSLDAINKAIGSFSFKSNSKFNRVQSVKSKTDCLLTSTILRVPRPF